MSTLIRQTSARFSDMLPPKIGTNLYSYHLTKLIKTGYVKKQDDSYTLDVSGLLYAALLSDYSDNAIQYVIQNSDGDILLQRQGAQPYIDTWGLPTVTASSNDASISMSAQLGAYEKFGLASQPMIHAGDCYVRVSRGDKRITAKFAHVFTFNRDNISTGKRLQWMRPHKLSQYSLTPGTQQVMDRTFFRDQFFFEEFEEAW